jgi:hypothetical protein
MGDHYAPQYYLRGFTCPTDGMIWTYEKGGTIKFQTDVKNTGHETNYYSPEVENYLAEEPLQTLLASSTMQVMSLGLQSLYPRKIITLIG